MQDFIVLGIVPGTQIQLSFMFWVYCGLGFFSLIFVVHMAKKHSLRGYIASLQISHTINEYELVAL